MVKIETTHAELVMAFRAWNIDYINNPETYDEIDKTLTTAESQADILIQFLSK